MVAKPKKEKKTETNNKYEEIQKDLQKQRSVLLAEAGETIGTAGLSPAPENLPDTSDQASAEADQFFLLRLREREQKLLKKIDDALDRIANNTFGICERCGGEIGYKRLKARPVTTLCIDCKTKQEEEEKIREM
jgi:RNA polymerase-binding transcription factor